MLATWNLCLGLSNKKYIVVDILSEYNINICCLQEVEIPAGYPENILNCGGYNLELEKNSNKKRSGIYIKTGTNYTRRFDLEIENSHFVVIDVQAEINLG